MTVEETLAQLDKRVSILEIREDTGMEVRKELSSRVDQHGKLLSDVTGWVKLVDERMTNMNRLIIDGFAEIRRDLNGFQQEVDERITAISQKADGKAKEVLLQTGQILVIIGTVAGVVFGFMKLFLHS